jgi:Flp pilus assembly protein TadG
MEALWLLVVPVLLVGGFFMIRSFSRLSKSIRELRTAMTDLADAGAALNSVQEEVSRLGATVDEAHRQ